MTKAFYLAAAFSGLLFVKVLGGSKGDSQKMMENGMSGFGISWVLLCLAIFVLPFWRICTKAGYSGWLSLLMLVPMINVVFIYFLGFSEWPSLRGDKSTNG